MPASFADLLRRLRLTAGLTQEALAERAGLSVNGIQKLESGGTHPYRETARRLVQALQLTPEDRAAFQFAAQTPPRIRVSDARSVTDDVQRLPAALTSFIGRQREVDELVRLLPKARLLTLTGVGGCGKTRLALEVARLVCDGYSDGVRVVELALLADPALVLQAVATAFGVRETQTQPLATTLVVALKRRHALLLIDNCEHLLDECAHLAHTLLRGCPDLQILATSREPLGLEGEMCHRVPSLPVPPLDPPPTPAQIGEYAAVQLLLDRVRAFSPGFAITNGNAGAIAQVCAGLDGIPLALELAAALVRGLSIEDIAARLDQRFALLTSGSRAALPRQQTLRATIDWSYDLLSAPERELFHRLSAFSGRWNLEAAEAVCPAEGLGRDQVPQLLVRLVDRSLVVAEEQPDGTGRYRLLDSLRHYGRERLLASGQLEAVLAQHARYYLMLAERAEPELNGPSQVAWVERLELDHSDLTAALDCLVARSEVQAALRLAGVLSRFWEIRSNLSEGRRKLTTLLALPGASAPTLARAKVLHGAAVLAVHQGDYSATRSLLKESLALYRRHRQLSGIAWVQLYLGWLCHEEGRLKAARRFAREALTLFRQLDDRRGLAMCLNVLGMVDFTDGHPSTGRSLHEECLALSREIGDRWGTAWALTNLGCDLLAQIELGEADAQAADVALAESEAIWRELGERRHLAFTYKYQGVAALWQGNFDLAQTRFDQSQSICTDLQDVPGMVNILWAWAKLFAARGQHEPALRLIGAAHAHDKAAHRVPAMDRLRMDRRLDAARSVVDAELVDAALRVGSTMSLDAALAYTRQQLSLSVPGVS